MSTQIFVNLSVRDLPKSVDFFKRLGFGFNTQYSDDTAACMVIGDNIYAMLLTQAKFAGFAPNPVCDARKATEVLLCISRDSREAVDAMVQQAVAAGGTTYREPQDHGFMYWHAFQDLDGHAWELTHMSSEAPQG